MSSIPLVSVVIPVHNRPIELKRSVGSVLSQTYENFEVIIIDDCSSDQTFSVTRALYKADDRISAYSNPTHGGSAYSRNEGVKKSKGELIAFLDSDDEWFPDKLEKQTILMDDRENTVLFAYFLLKRGRRLIKEGPGMIRTGNIRQALLKGWCPPLTSLTMLKREHFEKAGGYSNDLKSMQDYDLLIKLSEFCEFDCVLEYLAQLNTGSDVRVSIHPEYRIAGVENFLDKWAPTIAEEAGPQYVECIRGAHLGTVYFHAALKALVGKNRAEAKLLRKKLLDINQLSPKRRTALFLYAVWHGCLFDG